MLFAGGIHLYSSGSGFYGVLKIGSIKFVDFVDEL